MESTTTRTAGQTVEFRGHLFDSLTLSKITDTIIQLGGHYRLNDIKIGTFKKDISSVNMTIFAETEEKLAVLMEEMRHYGALPTGEVNVEACPCPADADLPEEAFCIKLPGRIYYEGRWIDLHAGESLAIAIYPDKNEARLENVDNIKQGALVVCGTQGIEW